MICQQCGRRRDVKPSRHQRFCNRTCMGKFFSGNNNPAVQTGVHSRPEWKEKQSIAHAGKSQSLETIAKISRANRGKTRTAESRGHISQGIRDAYLRRGFRYSMETRGKMSEARRGVPCAEKTRAYLRQCVGNRNHFFGRQHIDSTCKTMSIKASARFLQDDYLRKFFAYSCFQNTLRSAQCRRGISTSLMEKIVRGEILKFKIKRSLKNGQGSELSQLQ